MQKSDWSVLKDRAVTLWPDHDQAGLNAAQKITDILENQEHMAVRTVDLPSTLPHKWDLADKLPDGHDVNALIKTSLIKTPEFALEKNYFGKDPLKSQSINNRARMDFICEAYRLKDTFGVLKDADYEKVHVLFETFKNMHTNLTISFDENFLLKRSLFIVHYQRDYTNLILSPQQQTRVCLVASTLFAEEKIGGLNFNTEVHFKAEAIVKSHNQSQDSASRENNFKEAYGLTLHPSSKVSEKDLFPLQRNLYLQIQDLHQHYRYQRQMKQETLQKIKEIQNLHKDPFDPKVADYRTQMNLICESSQLQDTFGVLKDADYEKAYSLFETFKQTYTNSNLNIDDNFLLKRSLFVVHHQRTYVSLPLPQNERTRICLVASTFFAQQEEGDLALNAQAHFKAENIVKSHNQSQDSASRENNFKEVYGLDPHPSRKLSQNDLAPLQEKLWTQIQDLHQYYQYQLERETPQKTQEVQYPYHNENESEPPAYEKTFTYNELYAYANHDSSSYLMSEENEPLLVLVANEAYKELKEWHAITGQPFKEDKLRLQTTFTSLYTVWAKGMLDTHPEETRSLEKSLMIGAIAGKIKVEGTTLNDRDILFQAKADHRALEESIQKELTKHLPLLKQCSHIAKEEILRSALRCHAITGKTIPSETMQEFVKTLEITCSKEQNHQVVRGVVQNIREQKAKNPPTLEKITLHEASLAKKQRDELFQKAIKMCQDRVLQMEQQRSLERQLDRGLDISF